ncbi:MAG: Crp/Fnr family transcriptional regulator [Deltaproteobacteria bacterium]|nr:Crp/Fnr family transcriptional regulator [Deltaproteobacteria bacterium]MCB9479082.1 Crp/Fnr family transcriptional regulator [Deltaproteobacteria bacterium]MCB9488144.1 Crp/Fnr family transcriptional regulator [Deltaproteobacteria bacterium]
MDDLEILKNIFIFSSFGADGLAQLRDLSTAESYRKGASLFWEGDRPEWLWIVKTGKVKVFKQSASGKETILRIVHAGEVFGELALFDGRPYPDSAKAMESCEVLRLPRTEFLRLVREHPTVSFEILLELSARLREAQETIQALAVERVEKRIATLLLKLADRMGRGEGEAVRIPVNLTRQDVADMVGSTVETSIRILSRLAKDGVIETKGKTIYIRDMERLAAIPDEVL